MTLGSRAVAPLVVVALASCGRHEAETLPPYGQLVVYIDTDAPLPAAPGESLGPDDPTPLFDRLRVEVIRPGESTPCSDCTHEFDVDRTLFAARRASIGITPPVGASGYLVRARLFRAAHVDLGEPRREAALDTTAKMPPIAPEGITAVTIVLRTDDVARPVGSLASPVAPADGAPSTTLVGSWPGARRVPCAGPAVDGEVCVPGGAYWMGNPLARLATMPGDKMTLRLVTLSPFFLDLREVVVGEFRASGLAKTADPIRYDPTNGQGGQIVRCTYVDAPGDNDQLPVTCLSWERAEQFCEQRGGALPTEAQYQYVASAFASQLFPWGDDLPGCSDAVYARARNFTNPDLRCAGAWVEPAGSGRRDRLAIAGKEILDLAGNVAEHVRDVWNLSTESCWGTGLFHDPVCNAPSADPLANGSHTRVGGSFLDYAGALAATVRRPYVDFSKVVPRSVATELNIAAALTQTGFRCARQGG